MSGGLDSCVTAATAARDHDLAAMFVAYGQRTEERERRAFREIAEKMGIEKTIELDLKYLGQMGGSSLTDNSQPIPDQPPPENGVPTTYVPFRNGNLLAAAFAWAETLGAVAVYIGAVAVDGPEGYPDTTPAFLKAFQRVADIGSRPDTGITIEAPLVEMEKADVVRRGIELGAPLELTWSCYQNEDRACGTCLSCVGRLKAFERAGVKDPINYENKE